MHEFKVWAPAADRVAVKIREDRHEMRRAGARGWWSACVEGAGPGTDYAFLLDGDQRPYPDPRAMWMPNGVHGSSRVYDAGAFKWTDEHWNAPPLASGVVYEMHIGTFTPEGTFDSAIEELRHHRGTRYHACRADYLFFGVFRATLAGDTTVSRCLLRVILWRA